jgi:hypothetical protein
MEALLFLKCLTGRQLQDIEQNISLKLEKRPRRIAPPGSN